MSAPIGKMMSVQTLLLNGSGEAPQRHGRKAPEKSIVRHVLVHIAGNMLTWHRSGLHGPMWRINAEQATNIFAPETAIPGPEVAEHLGRALVRRVTMLESNSNIDDVVGIVIDGLPPKEFTRDGDGASIFLTGKGRVTVPQELFGLSSESDLGVAWMTRFPKHTRHNLEVEGAMHLPGATYWFVHEDHPVLYFIEQNKDQFGMPEAWIEQLQNGWYRVAIEMFDYSLKALRDGILHHAPSTFDLTSLTVRLVRPDHEPWANVSPHIVESLVAPEILETDDPHAVAEAKMAALDRYLDRPLCVTLRLAVEYSLPNMHATQYEEEDVVMTTTTTTMGG